MALTNCTITSQSFTKTAGSAIGAANAQLIISPNKGYSVSASNFTNNTGTTAGILGITLSNSGTPGTAANTVLVNIDLDNSYVMPSANTSIIIDIDGAATLLPYTLSGTYTTTVSNATPSSQSNIAYSGSGQLGQQITVFTKTFTASAGHYFKVLPSYILTASNPNKYLITSTTTLDAESRVISITFTVKYTFSNASEAGDTILFSAVAEEYYVPVTGIKAYSIITTNIATTGATRTMTIYGDPGAIFSLTVYNETPTLITSVTNQAIPSSGYYTVNITFPSVLDSDEYDFVLTGDEVSNNFGGAGQQLDVFSIKQLFDLDIAIGLDHTDNMLIISANKTKTLFANTTLNDTDANFNHEFTITITEEPGISIDDSTVDLTEFTNTNYLTNGGTPINITGLTFTQIAGDEIKATLTANVESTGDLDVTSILSLDNYLSVIPNNHPVSSNFTINLASGATAGALLGSNTTDADGHPLTYYIMSLPSGGKLYKDVSKTMEITSSGYPNGLCPSVVYYEDNPAYSGNTSFTYAAYDTWDLGNTATVTVNIY